MSWNAEFKKVVADVGDGMNYHQAAATLRKVVQSKLLALTDIEKNPERFFEAHRLLAQHASRLGPGFFIRFTVHYNLFAGTVIGLGTEEQIEALVARNAIRPRLGCFGLTEVFAGVNSGLVVNTTAVFENGKFVINSPNPGASKNWISQGLVADEAVVVATTFINGKNIGPQAFLVSMRNENGELLPGITLKDMGIKTVGNDLDNALITFTKFTVPLNALLARYVKVSPQGVVEYPHGNLRTMDMIGQRLFSGRVCVSQAGLAFADSVFSKTKAYASKKKCWMPGGEINLIEVPQVADLFQRAEKELSTLNVFMKKLEAQLCACLRNRDIPPKKLQEAIAVGKVKCLETSIELCHALKQEVGSYALMAGTGFEQVDFLQCCKFAEGDSRILMQKMARDLTASGGNTLAEKEAVQKLKASLENEMQGGANKRVAWDRSWKLVYGLAEVHMKGVIQQTLQSSKL